MSAMSMDVGDSEAREAVAVDINLPEAALNLQMSRLGYQAALAAVSRAELPSLADFLN